MNKNHKILQLFSAPYIYIHFAHRIGFSPKHAHWWLDDDSKPWWNGTHTFQCDALYFVRQGSFFLRIGEQQYTVGVGDICYIPAGTEHERRIEGDGPVAKYYTHFDLNLGKNRLSDLFKIPYVSHLKRPQLAEELFDTLNKLNNAELPAARIGANGALLQLIWLYLEESAAAPLLCQKITDQSLQQAIEYINENLNRSLTTAELAAQTGYSTVHFNRIFKKNFGCTLLVYIGNVKLNYAKERLRETTLPVSVIAEELGFYDASYFGKFFKSKTGISPANYRKNMNYGI